MASTYSTNLGIELLGSGEQSGTWGTTTNNNLGNLLEQAVSGYGTAAVTTGATTIITLPNGASGTARNMVITVTGTGGANTFLEVPASKAKLYIIFNGATGAFTVKPTGFSGISVPASAKAILYCDGTNIVDATNYFSSLTLGAALPVASGGTSLTTLTANNVILGNGTSAPQFVAPTTSGNILTANGTTWASATPAYLGTVTSVAVSGGATGLTTSGGPITSAGTITLAGTLAVANGGTGATATTAYAVYTGNSAGTGFAAIANGTTNQIFTATTSGAPSWSSSFTGNVTGNATNVTGTVVVANGGTGVTSTTAYGVLCGGTTSTAAVQSVAVGTTGQVLTSNGASALPSMQNSGTVTSVAVSGGTTGLTTSGGPITTTGTITLAGTLAVANGGTNATTVSGARASLGLAGTVLQIVNSQTGAVSTGTTVIPQDDTVPQNTEGNQYMSLAITPTSATSKLKIDVVVNGAISASNSFIVAIFQDSTVSALAAINQNVGSNNIGTECSFSHYMVSGTTSATTFNIRCGGISAGTFTFNGQASARLFGGVMASSITITEIAA